MSTASDNAIRLADNKKEDEDGDCGQRRQDHWWKVATKNQWLQLTQQNTALIDAAADKLAYKLSTLEK